MERPRMAILRSDRKEVTVRPGSPGPAASTAAKGDAIDSTTAVTKSFLTAFRQHPAGVAIVTGDPGTGPVALTVSSLISVSVEPPTVAFSLSEASSSAQAAKGQDRPGQPPLLHDEGFDRQPAFPGHRHDGTLRLQHQPHAMTSCRTPFGMQQHRQFLPAYRPAGFRNQNIHNDLGFDDRASCCCTA